ncbi:MAG: thymidylate synthase [Bacteroidota bacterium]
MGLSIQLTNPLARLSTSDEKGYLFSALGELFWYLSGSNSLDFIEYYIKHYKQEAEGEIIYGAYGPRIFKLKRSDKIINQLKNVINSLKKNPTTKKAVIQLFDAMDIHESHKEIPCTCIMQFLIREGKLNMFVYMRSNDAYKGLPHDIFAFTMIQELVSKMTNTSLGAYYHYASSMHLYEEDLARAESYVDEGFHSTQIEMPPMSTTDFTILDVVLACESNIRNGNLEIDDNLSTYWKDILRLLKIYRHIKTKDYQLAKLVQEELSSQAYESPIQRRLYGKTNG